MTSGQIRQTSSARTVAFWGFKNMFWIFDYFKILFLYYSVTKKIKTMSRKITQESVEAFMSATPFTKSNMSVEVKPNVTILSLFGNEIAYRYNDPERTLSITNCGWRTNTTKERLNALPNVNICQRSGVWFLNGEQWNGELTDIEPMVN